VRGPRKLPLRLFFFPIRERKKKKKENPSRAAPNRPPTKKGFKRASLFLSLTRERRSWSRMPHTTKKKKKKPRREKRQKERKERKKEKKEHEKANPPAAPHSCCTAQRNPRAQNNRKTKTLENPFSESGTTLPARAPSPQRTHFPSCLGRVNGESRNRRPRDGRRGMRWRVTNERRKEKETR
jgi:hypothetical protein